MIISLKERTGQPCRPGCEPEKAQSADQWKESETCRLGHAAGVHNSMPVRPGDGGVDSRLGGASLAR